MGRESLQAATARAGSAVKLLRDSAARPHTFPVPPEFTNWRSEQHAWRSSCVLFDQSHHMTDLYLSGRDAAGLLADFGVNTFAKFAPGQAKQHVAVNTDGYLIGDGPVFHLEDELFDVVGHPTVLNWLQYQAETGGYDVTVERDDNSADRPAGPPKNFRYELQGPTAGSIVKKLTGQPGFELFGPCPGGGRDVARPWLHRQRARLRLPGDRRPGRQRAGHRGHRDVG